MTLQELGALLKQCREEKGISLEEVAGQIKISARYLVSIEEGSIDDLPHAVYTKGFIRSFGQYVGVNPEVLSESLQTIFPPEVLEDKMERTILFHEKPKRNWLKWLIWLFILALLGSGGWYISQHYEGSFFDLLKHPFSAVQEETSALPLVTARRTAELPDENALTLVVTTPEDELPLSIDTQTEFEENTPVIAVAIPQAPIIAHNVVITAKEDCYLEICADEAPNSIFTLIPPNIHTISFDKSLSLVVGNAGGVNIAYDGSDLGPVGKKKERKVLRFP